MKCPHRHLPVLCFSPKARSSFPRKLQRGGAGIHDITTILELRDRTGALSPVRKAFWDEAGFQCEFCTPGKRDLHARLGVSLKVEF